jgi:type VI secretion system secreted protein Hcp
MILMNFETQIKGDSKVSGHEDWITCSSIQFGVGRDVSTSGGGVSRDTSNPNFSEISVTKTTDMASSDLFFQSTCGKSLGKGEIHFIQTGGTDVKDQVYMKVELEDALISGYSVSSNGERPSETVTINFTKITYQYDDFSGAKKLTGTPKKYDLMANAPY